MALNILLVDTANNMKPQNSGASLRANVAAIGSGVTSLAVVFSSAMPSTSFVVTVTVLNITDSSVQFQPVTVTALSTTGFTVKWNAPTDSANYVLHYTAIGYI